MGNRNDDEIRAGILRTGGRDTWLDGLTALQNDLQTFGANLQRDAEERTDDWSRGSRMATYQKNANATLDAYATKNQGYIDHFTRYAADYDAQLGEGTTARILSMLENNGTWIDSVKGSLSDENNYWGQFEGAEDFDAYVRYRDKYAAIPEAADFVEKSAYVSTKKPDPTGLFTLLDQSFNGIYNDPTYEMVNGQEAAFFQSAQEQGDSILFGEVNGELRQITTDQRDIYNYLYATEGRESANRYLNDIRGELKYKKAKEEEARWQKMAAKHPVLSSVATVLTSPGRAAAFIGQAADLAIEGKIDPYNPLSYYQRMSSTVRGEVVKTIEESGKWGKVGSFAYNIGVSMGDFLVAAAMTGFQPELQAFSLTVMGMEAAADATVEAKERGLSDGKAFALGSIAGIIEAFTEKFSLDKWLRKDFSKGIVRYVLENMLVEASEEGLATLLNEGADFLIAGDQAKIRADLQARLEAGQDQTDALRAVLGEHLAQLGLDSLAGAISGGLLAGATAGVNVAFSHGSISAEVQAISDAFDRMEEHYNSLSGDEKAAFGQRVAQYADNVEQMITEAQTGENAETMRAGEYEAAQKLIKKLDALRARLTSTQTQTTQQSAGRSATADSMTRLIGDAGIGEAGAGVMRSFYDGGDLVQYAREFLPFYNAGKNGRGLHTMVGRAVKLSQNGQAAAYNAGQMDAIREGGQLENQSYVRDGGERAAGADTGRVVSVVESGAGQTAAERTGSAGQIALASRQNVAAEQVNTRVSAKDLGITGGDDTAKVTVLRRQSWTAEQKKAAATAAARGLNVTYYAGGDLSIGGHTGVRAVIDGDRIFVRADHERFTVTQLTEHEIAHDRIAKGEVRVDDVRRAVANQIGEDGLATLDACYRNAYAGTGYAEDAVQEEMACDLLAGMNVFDGMQEKARAQVDRYMAADRQTERAEEAAPRGPPETGSEDTHEQGNVRFSSITTPEGVSFVAVEPSSVAAMEQYKGNTYPAKVRNYLKQYRSTVLPLGSTDKAYMRKEGENEYTNPAKFLSKEAYRNKLKAASEIRELLQSAVFDRHEADDGSHPDAVRGWNTYKVNFVVPTDAGSLRVYSGEIKIKLIARGDCFYDMTKIEDITNGNVGQTLIKAAGSVYKSSTSSITEPGEKVNTFSEKSSEKSSEGQEKTGKKNAEPKASTEGSDPQSGKNEPYDFSKPFAEQLDDLQRIPKAFPRKDSLVISGTPKVFQQIGLQALPMTYTQSHAWDNIHNYDGDHLGEALLKEVPDALQDPIAIIDSSSQPGRLVAIIELKGQLRNIIAAVEINGEGIMHGDRIDSNAILTIHSRDNALSKLLLDAVVSEVAGHGGIYYWQKNKAIAMARSRGVQFPGCSTIADGFIRSIYDFKSKVKPKIKNIFETKQFKRWFGQSKTVNEDGTPQVFYHGTMKENGDFYVFDETKAVKRGGHGLKTLGKGNYFTTKDLTGSNRFGGRVIPAYLKIESPVVLNSFDEYEKTVSDILGVDISQYSPDEVQQMLREKGYDGVIVKGSDSTVAVTFDSNQIKSATENIGTFDESNPDIRFSLDTAAETEAEKPADQNFYERMVDNATQVSSQEERAAQLIHSIAIKADELRAFTDRNYARVHDVPISVNALNDDSFKNIVKTASQIFFDGKLSPRKVRENISALVSFFSPENQIFMDFLHDIAAAKDGTSDAMLGVITDAFDVLSQNYDEEAGAYSAGPLSVAELAAVEKILRLTKKIYTSYDAIYEDGKRRSLTEAAQAWCAVAEQVRIERRYAHENTKRLAVLREKVRDAAWWYNSWCGAPNVVAGHLDGYKPGGFFTHYVERFQADSWEMQRIRMELMQPAEDFIKAHKGYDQRLTKERIPYKGTHGTPILVAEAIDIYLQSTQQNGALTLYGKNGGGFTYTGENGRPAEQPLHYMRKEDLDNLYNAFSADDKKFIEIVKKAYTDGGVYKEKTDIERIGFSNVMGSGYYSISRDKTRIQKAVGDVRADVRDVPVVNNIAFNKKRSKNAHIIPLAAKNVYTKLQEYCRLTGLYAAMSADISNFNRIYNKNIEDENRGHYQSVRLIAGGLWDGTEKYFSTYLKNVQGARDSEAGTAERLMAAARSNYAKSALGLNPKVVVGQFASYPSALAYLDPDVLLKALNVATVRSDHTEMDRYSVTARLRNADKIVVKAESLYDHVGKLADAGTKGIQLNDRFTIGRLWVACQMQVAKDEMQNARDEVAIAKENAVKAVGPDAVKEAQADLEKVEKHLQTVIEGVGKVGTEANMKAAGALLDKVITRTQPTYQAADRSALQRSNNELVKAVAMFTSVSMKQFSLVVGAVDKVLCCKQAVQYAENEANRSENTKRPDADAQLKQARENLKRAQKEMGRALSGVLAANLLYAMLCLGVQAIFGRLRGKKPHEELVKMFLSTNISMFPIIKELYSAFSSGYDIEVAPLSGINDLVSAIKGMASDKYSVAHRIETLLEAVSALFVGLPLQNLRRYTIDAIDTAADATDNYVLQYHLAKLKYRLDPQNGRMFYDILYEAYQDSPEDFEEIYNDMISHGWKQENIRAAMETRMKQDQGISSVGDLEQRFLTPSEKRIYDSTVQNMQKSDVWKGADQEQKDKALAIVNDYVAGRNTTATKHIEDGKDLGLSADEYALYVIALDMVDEPNASGKRGTYTKAEMARAVEMLADILDDEEEEFLRNGARKKN